MNLIQTMIDKGFALSKAEARRYVNQGCVKVNGETVTTTEEGESTLKEGDTLQVGKRSLPVD